MKIAKRTIAGIVLACALVVAGAGVSLPAFADDESAARALLVEAVLRAEEAKTEPDPARRATLLSESVSRLNEIVDRYPSSEIAVMLVTGQAIGEFQPKDVRRDLALAEEALAEQGAASAVAEPEPALTEPTGSSSDSVEQTPAPDEEPVVAETGPAPDEAERSIPVAPIDPESAAGRIVYAIADRLEEWLGADTPAPRLTLAAPIWADERGDTVTVHAPGARLVGDDGSYGALGSLSMAVTPRSDTEYGFETALPPMIRSRAPSGEEDGRVTVGDSAISGVWRSDMESTTAFNAAVSDVRLFIDEGPNEIEVASLGSLTATEDLVQQPGGLWNGDYAVNLSDIRLAFEQNEGFQLSAIDVISDFEGFDLDQMAKISQSFQFSPSMVEETVDPAQLQEALQLFVEAEWGVSDTKVTLRGLEVMDGSAVPFRLGELVWQIFFDGRGDLTNIGMAVTVLDPSGEDEMGSEIPPELIPSRAKIDFSLSQFPLRRIVEMSQGFVDPTAGAPPSEGEVQGMLMMQLVEAETSLDINEIHLVAPAVEIMADGQFKVEPTSMIGAIGKMNARIMGLDGVMELAAQRSEQDPEMGEMMAFLVFLQGLGRPVFEEGSDSPIYVYELDVPADGAVSVNGTPLDFLFGNGTALSGGEQDTLAATAE